MIERRCAAIFAGLCLSSVAAGCVPSSFTFQEGAGGAGSSASSASSSGAGGSASSGGGGGGGGSGPVAVCSDGKITPPEVCDDGNTESGDKCASNCLCGDPAQDLVAFNGVDGHCYVIHHMKLTWDDAKTYCEAAMKGSHLATVTTEAERDMISKYGMATQVVWLGAQDLATEGTWKWLDNEPWLMKPCGADPGCDSALDLWATNEPNDQTGTEDCLSLDTSVNRLNDLVCTYQNYPLCEIAPSP